MTRYYSIAAILAAFAAAHAAEPDEVWEQAVKAKGGRERLHSVHALAIFMTPANVNLRGLPTNWLCVFPDRYFEFDGTGVGGRQRAIVVNRTTGLVAADETGIPRGARPLSAAENDRLALNQLIYLLESAWLKPKPVEVRHNVLFVEAAGRTYKLSLNRDHLPERVVSLPLPSEKPKTTYDFHLQHYRDFQGLQLPLRVAAVTGAHQQTWDVDYEVDARYNPKLFERTPDLSKGPEPWRQR